MLDPHLFALVLATAFSTAAGFIINNFYDAERDRINHPQKYLLEHLISLRTQLLLYFLLNGAALVLCPIHQHVDQLFDVRLHSIKYVILFARFTFCQQRWRATHLASGRAFSDMRTCYASKKQP